MGVGEMGVCGVGGGTCQALLLLVSVGVLSIGGAQDGLRVGVGVGVYCRRVGGAAAGCRRVCFEDGLVLDWLSNTLTVVVAWVLTMLLTEVDRFTLRERWLGIVVVGDSLGILWHMFDAVGNGGNFAVLSYNFVTAVEGRFVVLL